MADIERALLSKAAQTGQFEQLISLGLNEDHFEKPIHREIWNACLNHQRRYKAPLSFGELKNKFSDYEWGVSSDPLAYIKDQFVVSVKRRAAIDGIRSLAKIVDDSNEVENIDIHMLDVARQVSQAVPSSGKVARFSEMPQRISNYHETPLGGLPMGIPTFDNLTLGIQPHEYVSIVGYTGSGKSTLLQWVFMNAYCQGFTPMLISLEMDGEVLNRKWDAMAANLNYHALKSQELDKKSLERWEQYAERAANAKNDIIVLDDLGFCSVDKIYAETVRYQPDLVGVDYISLLKAPRHGNFWEKVTMITQALKQNARTLRIPIVAVAQTNRNSAESGPKLDNIAYANSVGQDSDLIFGLQQTEEMKEVSKMEVSLLKNRDGPISTTKMHWDMAHMQFKEWQTKDLFRGVAKKGTKEKDEVYSESSST